MRRVLGSTWPPPRGKYPGGLVFIAIFVAIALISALGIAGMLPIGGSKVGLVVAAVCILSPLIVLLWARWPVIAPFALYAALVPFDGFPLGGIGGVPRLLGMLSFGALLLSALVRRQIVRPPLAVAAWGLATLWMATSLAWATMLPRAELQLQQIVQLAGLALVVSIVRVSLVELNVVVIATILGGVAASLFEIHFYQAGSTYSHASGAAARACVEVAGGCLDANFFAAGLLLPIVLATVAGLRSRSFISKLIFMALAMGGLWGVFVSGSRGAFFALVPSLLYLVWRTRYRFQLAAVALAGLLASLAMPVIWARIADPSQGEASGRFVAWKVGLLAFQNHWLTGVGMGSYRDAYESAYLRVFQPLAFHTPSQDPHDLIIQTGVELGVIGLVLVLGAWVVQFGVLRKMPRESPLYDLRCAVEAATIALFVAALSVDLMDFKFTWLCFYLAFLVRSAWRDLPQAAVRLAPREPPPGRLLFRHKAAEIPPNRVGNFPSQSA